MNNIDDLWPRLNAISPDELTPKDYDDLIAAIRGHRASIAAGHKVKKDTGPKAELPSMADLGIVKPKTVVEFKRRL